MRRVHVGPIIIIVYIDFVFQFLLATKIVPGKEAGSKEARKRKWEAASSYWKAPTRPTST